MDYLQRKSCPHADEEGRGLKWKWYRPRYIPAQAKKKGAKAPFFVYASLCLLSKKARRVRLTFYRDQVAIRDVPFFKEAHSYELVQAGA